VVFIREAEVLEQTAVKVVVQKLVAGVKNQRVPFFGVDKGGSGFAFVFDCRHETGVCQLREFGDGVVHLLGLSQLGAPAEVVVELRLVQLVAVCKVLVQHLLHLPAFVTRDLLLRAAFVNVDLARLNVLN